MSKIISRRKLLMAGAAVAGASGLEMAVRLAGRYGLIPPDHGGIFGVGETLTYASQRILMMSHHSRAREFNRSEISKVAPMKGKPPETEIYHRLVAGKFADWRLTIDGLVDRPASFSLAELKQFPASSQITHQACEEGWSFIAEWVGVPLSYVLNLVGARPQAKYVVFFTLDMAPPGRFPPNKFYSIDMGDAWHPQSLLAYGMNGAELPPPHGAPIRLKVPRQLGGKNAKYLSRVTLVDSVSNIGRGIGGTSSENGFSWYFGI